MLLENLCPKCFNSRPLLSFRCRHHTSFKSALATSFLRDHGTWYMEYDKDFDSSRRTHYFGDDQSNASHVQLLRDRTVSFYSTTHLPSKRDLRHYHHSAEVSTSGSYSVLQSSSLQHWFKNWQELRKHKLTASTFAGAIGFWRGRRVQLWLEKLGLIKPFTGNIATCWSNIREEVALERYKLITGNTVSFPEFQIYNHTDTEDDWLGASPDGVVDHVVYGLPCDGVLEVKCPFYNGELKRALPWSRIPLHYMPQAQGLMEIMDKNWMDFYVWTPNGSSLFRIHRDPQYWELLKSALSDFWWKHVQPAKELRRLDPTTDPFTLLKPLKPASQHELCSTIVDASKHLVYGSDLLVREIHGKLRD